MRWLLLLVLLLTLGCTKADETKEVKEGLPLLAVQEIDRCREANSDDCFSKLASVLTVVDVRKGEETCELVKDEALKVRCYLEIIPRVAVEDPQAAARMCGRFAGRAWNDNCFLRISVALASKGQTYCGYIQTLDIQHICTIVAAAPNDREKAVRDCYNITSTEECLMSVAGALAPLTEEAFEVCELVEEKESCYYLAIFYADMHSHLRGRELCQKHASHAEAYQGCSSWLSRISPYVG